MPTPRPDHDFGKTIHMATQRETTSGPSLPRILNSTAIAVIALSVLAQFIGFGIKLVGATERSDPGLLSVFGFLSITIIPGVFLAFVKFLLNAIRSFRDAKARIRTLVYLVITLSPFILLRKH